MIGDESKSNHEHVLFVYGTLRHGFPNHHLLEGAAFLGRAKTVEKYSLYAEGIPYVTRDGAISAVVGEVFEVDTETLERIDRLEGHPHWYRREIIQVVIDGGTEIWAWLYFSSSPRGKLVESGDYARTKQPHHDVSGGHNV
jgi:gamma-glutamylaminecyclotransferase